MSNFFKAQKLISSPPTPPTEPSTLFMVRVGAGFDFYMSDITGGFVFKLNSPEVSVDTGDLQYSYAASKSGWLLVDGDITIGNTSSGANHEGSEYENLFNVVKLASPNLGTEDFAGGDTVELRLANCVLAAKSTESSRLTVAGSGVNGTVLGSQEGSEVHQLSSDELATHQSWAGTRRSNSNRAGGSGSSYLTQAYGWNASSWNSPVHFATNDSLEARDNPHQNTQPTAVLNLFVKL